MQSLICGVSGTRMDLLEGRNGVTVTLGCNIARVSPSADSRGCDVSGRCEDTSLCANPARSSSWAIVCGSSCWPMDDGRALVFGPSDAICAPGAGGEDGLQSPVEK